MASIRKIKAGLVPIGINRFVGEEGIIFYDPAVGDLFLSDGVTPGGIPMGTGGGGSGNIDLSAVDQHIIPATDSTYDLGTPDKQWRSLYVSTNTIYIDNTPITISNNTLVVGDVNNRVTLATLDDVENIPKGDKGDPGDKGDQGDPGTNGTNGQDGAPGVKGDKGDQGDQGDPGMPGINGTNGQDGAPGVKGDKGDKGDQGDPGTPGINGTNGQDGHLDRMA